ncbi:hypothetical protein MNB_SM-5-132 [hydrothermal vent metagenome]|uniref:Inner membrane protein YgaP-like transmembrane domain-containing protein n=1 Tax=hydrothermal vent metagenome TaxID=652676 RepID=A0A1W1BXB6_9ZZZZ
MDFNKIRKVCRVVRIIVGLALIVTGIITGIKWFYLGLLPLIAGIANFCPLCIFSKKCDLPQKSE